MTFFHFWNVKFIYDTKDVVVFFDGSYKYLNRNVNYCIDHLFFEFVKPLVDSEHITSLNSMFDYNFSTLEKSYYSDDYYCCEYCCGDYNNWLESKNEYKYKIYKEDIYKKISEFLNTKRTKYKGSYKEFK